MDVAEFLRLFPLRAPNLMWLLGAGASASSGIATAGDMILDFKRRLYCSEQGISLRACEDLSNPVVQGRIQRYLDGRGGCPAGGAEEEYSHYFSAVFPNESDRRRYIEQLISKATPSYGFLALGVLMKVGQARVLWTTNFDRNIEDAAAGILKTTGKLVVSSLDAPGLMREALQEGRWPLLGKLHGDFQSRRLKNTSEELQTQDAELRRELVETCRRLGLIVCGYSGRDLSVMAALEEAIDGGRGYPSGLFWFTRNGASARVVSFVEKARAAGVDAHLITVETFDELLADIVAQLPNVPKEDVEFLNSKVQRISEATMPHGRGGWPVVRLNAVEVIKFPTVCRVVRCEIGGVGEVYEAVEASGANIVATRRKAGVLLFGSDAEAAKAFGGFKMDGSDLYTIEPRRLWYDSIEGGLIYDGLVQALVRERGFVSERRRGQRILRVDTKEEGSARLAPLKKVVNVICGTVGKTSVPWAEAMEIHLEYRMGRLWLVIEPTVWVGRPGDGEREVVREFQRERHAVRYNRVANELLAAWCEVISAQQPVAKLSAFGISDGIDAVFEIGDTTAYSRRLVAR